MLPGNYRFRFINIFKNLRANVYKEKKRGVDDLTEDFYFKEFDANEDLNLEVCL